MHNVTIHGYDPSPDDVTVTKYHHEGQPRATVDIGPMRIYGSRVELAAVLGHILRLLSDNQVEPPKPLAGDYTYMASPPPKAGDVIALGQIGGPSLELEVTEVIPGSMGAAVLGQVLRVISPKGETVGTIDMAAPPDRLTKAMADLAESVDQAKAARDRHPTVRIRSDLSEDPATPPDPGPEVFEDGKWRPARPGEVVTETEPFEAEGGPTDG